MKNGQDSREIRAALSFRAKMAASAAIFAWESVSFRKGDNRGERIDPAASTFARTIDNAPEMCYLSCTEKTEGYRSGDVCERRRGRKQRAKRSGSGRNLASEQRAEDFAHRNRGRLRAPPGAEAASKKEWQRSKSCERTASGRFRSPQQDITGRPRERAPGLRPYLRGNLRQYHIVVISHPGVNIHGGLPKRS